MQIYNVLDKNQKYLQQKLQSDDVMFYSLKINGVKAFLVYISSMINKKDVGSLIIKPLAEFKKEVNFHAVSNALQSPETKEAYTLSDIIGEVTLGNTVLVIDGFTTALSFALKNVEKRNISEPPTSAVIKGPREGFVENIETNLNLLRQRVKSENFKVEYIYTGKYSKTLIAVCYVKGVVKEGLVEEIKKKLNKIEIDAILDSSYVSRFLSEKQNTLFKQIGTTEKPDIATSKIMEGRLAVLVDGSPIALTVPYILLEDFQSPEDYYSSTFKANLSRLIRVFAVFVSIMLPSVFVSAQLFHMELIPLNFLLTIVNSIQGIPLSPAFEMFFALIIFETLNEASVRMPKYVGMAVSIVGGLVLGETAVNAGIISAPTLMIIALSGICLYTVPELTQTFSVIRIIFLIIAGSIGIYGILAASAILLIYLTTFETYGTPLLAPYAPIIFSDLKDGINKIPTLEADTRPIVFKSPNKIRLKHKQEKEKNERD